MMTLRHEDGLHTCELLDSQTSLQSPTHLPELNTPSSTLSLAITDVTPLADSTDALARSFSKLNMRSPSIPILSTYSSDSRAGDIHSKLQAEARLRSKVDTMDSVVRAFSSSKTLHQVLGLRKPEPFVTPPEVPHNLIDRFETGLQKYESLFSAGAFASTVTAGVQAAQPLQKGKAELADILEEKESPTHITPVRSANPGTGSALKVNVPKWTASKQAVAVAQQCTFLESDSEAAEDTASEHANHELGADENSFWEYGSNTTLAASDCSRSGSPASARELSSVPAPFPPPRTTSLVQHNHVDGGNTVSSSPPHHFENNILPPRPLRQPTHPAAPVTTRLWKTPLDQVANIRLSTLRTTESLPVLLPSSGVEQRSWDLGQTDDGAVSSRIKGEFRVAHKSSNLDFTLDSSSLQVPHINPALQAPSPEISPTSRKRGPSMSALNDLGPSPSRRARRDDTAGLPILPLEAEALWKFKFQGNTYALLTILLSWSQTMWTFHRRLPDPKLLAIHPAFPYPIAPPLTEKLLSISFYDTSFEPHKEIRYLGPGDVAEMSYHEVDIFGDPENQDDNQRKTQPRFPMTSIRKTLSKSVPGNLKHKRYMTMAQRAKTGEGRWCYILLKGQQTADEATPPHLILAWHISAITAKSTCLHTIYPDHVTPTPAIQPQSKLKRFSSLQNLGTALRHPARFGLHQPLRSASSSAELPPGDARTEMGQGVGKTLHRTVLKLERAGSVPLIEGFRIDVEAFRGWLEACGKGKGKVIMWRERDGG